MQLFYLPEIKDTCYLDEAESRHCIKVLRLKQGDTIYLTDGKGFFYLAKISDTNPKHCQLIITQKEEEQKTRNYQLHIAIAPTKNIDRFEWFLEKVTEIGVDEITPIVTENSERKVVKLERLEKIVISAMKQSLKATKPIIHPIINFKDFIGHETNAQKYIGHCYEGDKKELIHSISTKEKHIVLIGPEGDFSLSEVEEAIAKGFQPVSLGNSRLRTETAGIVACHTLAIKNS